MNKYLKTVVIAPITSNPRKYPSRVLIKREGKKWNIVLDQIRRIDKRRVINLYEKITTNQIQEVKTTFKKIFVDH
jgi:mRNA interferase MazF